MHRKATVHRPSSTLASRFDATIAGAFHVVGATVTRGCEFFVKAKSAISPATFVSALSQSVRVVAVGSRLARRPGASNSGSDGVDAAMLAVGGAEFSENGKLSFSIAHRSKLSALEPS